MRARPQLRQQHRSGARSGRAVGDAAHLVGSRAAPAVLAVEIQLVLVDEEAAALEQPHPVVHRALHLPALVVVLAGRHAHEQPALAREHAMQLAQGGLVAGVVARRVDVVDLVVAADVLERREAERQVDRAVGERQLAHVRDDGAESRDGLLAEVDADEVVRAERRQPGEVRRLREDVAKVEHPLLVVVAGEAPRNLDRALVARRGCAQLAWARRPAHVARPGALARGERDGVVQQRHLGELVARHELPQEPRPGQRPVTEPVQRTLPRLLVGPRRRTRRQARSTNFSSVPAAASSQASSSPCMSQS